jgi:D-3-phosphoglycerate dehydrogenase
MSAKVLITTSSFGQPKELVEKAGYAVALNPHKRKLTEAEVTALLAEHKPVGMIAGVEPLTAAVLEAAASHLKVVSRCGVGLDSVDLAAASRLGIKVLSTPDAPSPAVAELAVALMLDCSRKVSEADRALRAGKWQALQGRLLGDKTVGVLGLGRIGSRVCRILSGFGCSVLGYDPAESAGVPGVDKVSFDEVLAESDIVTLHLPITDGTRHLIDAQRLSKMKKGSILINCARGGLVDEKALADALASGQIAAAGLDCFENEPYTGPLTSLPNVVLTAHMGSAAQECRGRMENEAALNLLGGLK